MEENYKINDAYSFDISISKRFYDHKPTSSDYQKMSFRKTENVTPTQALDFLTQGYSVCHIFKGDRRKKNNFMYTYSVFIDIDDSTVSMTDFIAGCDADWKPTLAYTTPSNGLPDKGYRFRLMYVFDGKISSEIEYKSLYFNLLNELGLQNTKDNCGSISNQLMNGNSKSNVEVYNSNRVYSYSNLKFIFPIKHLETSNIHTTHTIQDVTKKQFRKSNTEECGRKYSMTNEDIVAYNILERSSSEFLCRYSNIPLIKETNLIYNEDGYSFIPDDYLCLPFRYDWKKRKIIRFGIGEDRKKKIHIDLCIMKLINHNASFVELLYNAVVRRLVCYDNSDNKITNRYLKDEVIDVLSHDPEDFTFIKSSPHGKFKVDKSYCSSHDVTPRQYARIIVKQLNHQKIASWYDPGKSISENFQFAKENHYKVCRSTLRRYCLEHNIEMNPHCVPIESWYDSSLPISENLQIAKDSDIKTSKTALYKWCKDNGVNPKGEPIDEDLPFPRPNDDETCPY